MIPFNIMTNSQDVSNQTKIYEEYHNYDRNIIIHDHLLQDKIISLLLNYRIPIIKVLKEIPKYMVCKVFKNFNQGGIPLNVFELLKATFITDDYDLKTEWKTLEKN